MYRCHTCNILEEIIQKVLLITTLESRSVDQQIMKGYRWVFTENVNFEEDSGLKTTPHI